MILSAILALCAQCSTAPDALIRGVYVNPYQANRRDYWQEIFEKADSGLINAVIVDFKSDHGFLAYDSKLELPNKIGAVKKLFDIDSLIARTARHNLKLIARIVCFRDNYLARHKDCGIRDDSARLWLDRKDMAWTNPFHDGVQEYLLAVTKELVDRGIRSVAYDYIRFPADGDVARIRLSRVKGSRVDAIARFLEKARRQTDAEIGICVFGFSVWRTLHAEGQDLQRLGGHIDVLYPMLYPSHFHRDFRNDGAENWRNFWIYFDSVREALGRLPRSVRVVPFVQGFEYRAASYDPDYIFSQIHGALAAAGNGFIIWNARSDYATGWPALEWTRRSVLMRRTTARPPGARRSEQPRYPEAWIDEPGPPGPDQDAGF